MHFLAITTNRSGVLARMTSIVSGLGANIQTMAAYPVEGSDLSVVHLRIEAGQICAERIRRKLSRLVDLHMVRMDQEPGELAIDFSVTPTISVARVAAG